MPMISCSKCGVHFDDCTGKKPAPQENEYDGYLCEPCYDEEADNHDGLSTTTTSTPYLPEL